MLVKELIELLQREPENNNLEIVIDSSALNISTIIDGIESKGRESIIHIQVLPR